MLLYSLTVLWFAREGHALYEPPLRPWYWHKVRLSFADMRTTLRYACLRPQFLRAHMTNRVDKTPSCSCPAP